MSLSKEQMELLNRVKDLISHVNPNPTMAELFEHLANNFLDRKDPLRKSTSKNQFQSVALMRQKVLKRDQTCQWRDKRTGKKCDSRFQLQVDHKRAKWLGGENKFENLQLLCSVHNKMKYKKEKRDIYGFF